MVRHMHDPKLRGALRVVYGFLQPSIPRQSAHATAVVLALLPGWLLRSHSGSCGDHHPSFGGSVSEAIHPGKHTAWCSACLDIQ
jgi:hypothetical protein